MKKLIVTLGTAAALVGAIPATASAAPSPLQKDANALIDQGAPGVIAQVVTPKGTKTVRAGVGNIKTGTPVPWNAKFRIGSFSKTYLAATMLQLVGEGKLSLDDTVDHWLPGVVKGNGNDGTKITVRQLLQHTSGLPDFVQNMPFLFTEQGFQQNRYRSFTAPQLVANALKSKPNFAPGSSWSYSNTNYVLAGLIVKKVTGHSWQSEITNRIIEPLGLHDTSVPGTDPRIPQPHAQGYERFPGPGATEQDPRYGDPIDVTALNPSWADAAGEVISTTADGNRFLRALLSGKVLRPAQLAQMKTTVAAKEFEGNWPGARYGLGLMWNPNPCGGTWSHGGDIQGFKTRNGVNASGTRSVVISMNTDSLVPKPGVPASRTDASIPLINDALCAG
jgi:D-alanyl-D-alanine carboxypeptidase